MWSDEFHIFPRGPAGVFCIVPRDSECAGRAKGGDVVLLNTHRKRKRLGPNAGRVSLFISVGPRVAAVFTRAEAAEVWSLGTPVPVIVARLAGWKVRGVRE